MLKEELTGVSIVRDNGTFYWLVTIKDLSHIMNNEDVQDLYTSVAGYRSTTFMSTVHLDENKNVTIEFKFQDEYNQLLNHINDKKM